MKKIRLSDAVRELREELTRARDEATTKDLMFDLESIVLEVEVAAENETGADGKVNWWVFSGGISDKSGQTHTQKITLTLSPHDASGKVIKVSQQQPQRADAIQTGSVAGEQE